MWQRFGGSATMLLVGLCAGVWLKGQQPPPEVVPAALVQRQAGRVEMARDRYIADPTSWEKAAGYLKALNAQRATLRVPGTSLAPTTEQEALLLRLEEIPHTIRQAQELDLLRDYVLYGPLDSRPPEPPRP